MFAEIQASHAKNAEFFINFCRKQASCCHGRIVGSSGATPYNLSAVWIPSGTSPAGWLFSSRVRHCRRQLRGGRQVGELQLKSEDSIDYSSLFNAVDIVEVMSLSSASVILTCGVADRCIGIGESREREFERDFADAYTYIFIKIYYADGFSSINNFII